MKAIVIAMLFVLLLPADTLAARHYQYRWDTSNVIVVENKLGPEWNEAVKAQAAAWHRAHPNLRFRVVNKPGKCRWREGAIVICSRTITNEAAAHARTGGGNREITKVRIEIQPEYADPMFIDTMLLCHEFGHALGLSHNDQPETSCLGSAWGTSLTTPGPYDAKSLRILYGKKGNKWP